MADDKDDKRLSDSRAYASGQRGSVACRLVKAAAAGDKEEEATGGG